MYQMSNDIFSICFLGDGIGPCCIAIDLVELVGLLVVPWDGDAKHILCASIQSFPVYL